MTTILDAAIGPQIGATAPRTTARLHTGETVNVHDLTHSEGLVIAFVRSLDWCPFCKKQIRLLDEITDELAALGWGAASLSYDSPEMLDQFAIKNDAKLTLLSDVNSEVIDAYALRNTKVKPGGKSVGVPHPAVVFLGADGTVREVLRHTGYQTRPSAEDVLNAARELEKS